MNGVYRSIADRDRLLRKERDPVTGRLVRTRDQKGRQAGGSDIVPPPARRSRFVIAAAVAVLVLVAMAGVAAAVHARRDSRDGADQRSAENRSAAPRTTAGSQGTTAVTDPPATAISLTYTGGTFTRRVCTDLLSPGACVPTSTGFDPLPVRCTPQQCQVTIFGQTVPLTATTNATGAFPYAGPQCGTAPWSVELRAVGSKVTRGIKHPARLVGQGTLTGQAQVLPDADCIGADEAYQYDAAPE